MRLPVGLSRGAVDRSWEEEMKKRFYSQLVFAIQSKGVLAFCFLNIINL